MPVITHQRLFCMPMPSSSERRPSYSVAMGRVATYGGAWTLSAPVLWPVNESRPDLAGDNWLGMVSTDRYPIA